MKHKTRPVLSPLPDTVFPDTDIYNMLDQGLILADPDLNITYFNPSAVRLLQQSFGTHCRPGRNLPDCLPGWTGLDSLLRGESMEQVFENGDRHPRTRLFLQALPLRSTHCAPRSFCLLLNDQSFRNQIDEIQARQSELEQRYDGNRLMFEQFMQNSPVAGWITDEKGIMHYMNPLYLKNYGFSEEDKGKSIYDIFPPQMAVDYHMNNLDVIRYKKPIETVEKALLSDGREQVIRVYKFPITFAHSTMVAGWAVDITDEALFQQQLVHSVERYHYVNEATSDGIYDWDIARKKIYKGSGFDRLFGAGESEMSLMERLRRIHSDDRERVKDIYFSSLRNTQTEKWSVEFRFRSIDGSYRHVQDKALIKRDDRKAVRVIGAFRDITEQKEAQLRSLEQEKIAKRQVMRSIIEAQEKERRKLSVNLHDNVNQILASCKLMLEVAREHHDAAQALLEKVYQNIQTVIGEVKTISQDLNPSAIEDIGLTEALCELVEKVNAGGQIQLSFTYSGMEVKGLLQEEDRIAIYRIVQEQVNNILRHSGATTAIVRLELKNRKIRLVVEDNGAGFNIRSVRRGTGLSSIQHRVDYYQGRVRFGSGRYKGCRMTVELNLP